MTHSLTKDQVLINRYQIKSFHAAGGMQEVYLCYDHALQRDVALKTPKNGVADRRFKRGAEMGARVNHPNIAATLDYYDDDNITFLIEEFVPGKDLGHRLQHEFFFFDPALAAHILHYISRAINEAHRADICHRDLKPSNIMTSSDLNFTEVKLTDFGIAKLAENEIAAEIDLFNKDDSTLTTSNTLLGAVPYMAPECWIDWRKAGQPIDIWAFGCIAYHFLSGEPPFGNGRNAIRNVMLYESGKFQIPRPKHFGNHPNTASLEKDLWSVIETCIQVDPKSRPSSSSLLSKFESMCFPSPKRRHGEILKFPVQYADGSLGNCGYIGSGATECFFHGSDFYGATPPEPQKKVSFNSYPGEPNPRAAPVLLLR